MRREFLAAKETVRACIAAFALAFLTSLSGCNHGTPTTQIPAGTEVFFPINVAEGYGAIDRNGKVLVEPSFEEVSQGYFGRTVPRRLVGQEGVLLINSDQWVYVGKQGATTHPPMIDDLRLVINQGDSLFALFSIARSSARDSFGPIPTMFDPTDRWAPPDGVHARRMLSEGLIAVTRDGKWGFADRQGQVIVEPAYDMAEPFFDGMAAVRIGELWGFINQKGDLAIAARYSAVSWFDDGLALAAEPDDERAFFIDKAGAQVREFAHDWTLPKTAFPGFVNGIMVVRARRPTSPKDRLDTTSGYIRTDGTWLMEPDLEGNYAESRFTAESAIANRPTGKFLVHHSGKIIKQLRDVPWNGFRFGLASDRKGKVGYIDTSGKSVWKPE